MMGICDTKEGKQNYICMGNPGVCKTMFVISLLRIIKYQKKTIYQIPSLLDQLIPNEVRIV